MPTSIQEQIVDAVALRLAAIKLSADYNTDLGKKIYLDRSDLFESADVLPAALVFDTEETPEKLTPRRYRNTLRITVDCFSTTTNMRGMLADIKQAVLLADATLGGLCHHLTYAGFERGRPEDGVKVETLSVLFDAVYDEDYGDPY